MMGVHCERFPECMEVGADRQVPICTKADCPGSLARDRAAAFLKGIAELRKPNDGY